MAAAIFPILLPRPLAPKLWLPKRVLLTRSAQRFAYATALAERASALGSEIITLSADQLPRARQTDARRVYAEAKSTLAVVVAPPSSQKLQPIAPSADWQFHLAKGCPAHCQYCYLAGSLPGPPITRVFANLDEILENLKAYEGKGVVTSRSKARNAEGTTFECSCYTDPLALEHLTGGLARAIEYFGHWNAPVQLRWTTKFNEVHSLLGLQHRLRTRVRFSLNAIRVAQRLEGGTSNIPARITALAQMAAAGYPVGLTIAPIMDIPHFEEEYGSLLEQVRDALKGIRDLDLTVELITHRFTSTSREILLGWYPKTPLDMNVDSRARKRNKFGGVKFVYPVQRMRQMRATIFALIEQLLPTCKILYWI